jgi:ATP-dependent RNA helicase RhlE
VVNYDMPDVPENYVHRIGRTARAGAGGVAIAFCAPEEREELHAVEKLIRLRIPVKPVPPGIAHPAPAPATQRPPAPAQGHAQAPRPATPPAAPAAHPAHRPPRRFLWQKKRFRR